MTITVKTEKIGNIQINLELSKHGFYKVFVYEYGKTIKESLPYTDKEKAAATFRRYKRGFMA